MEPEEDTAAVEREAEMARRQLEDSIRPALQDVEQAAREARGETND